MVLCLHDGRKCIYLNSHLMYASFKLQVMSGLIYRVSYVV